MQLKIKLFIFLLLGLSFQLVGQEMSVDLRFSPNETACYVGEDYCVTIQVRGNNGAHHIGNSTIQFNYDSNVLEFSGSSEGNIDKGTYTEINFGNNDGSSLDSPLNPTCTEAGGGDGYSPYAPHSFDGSTPGSLLIDLVLLEPSINTDDGPIIHACPSIESGWTDMSQICFEVLNPDGDPDLNFIGVSNSPLEDDGQGINFNNSCNDDTYKYWSGILEPLHSSYNDLCPSNVKVVLENYSDEIIGLAIMPNTTWPGNNTSSTEAQITIKVPTGLLEVDNLLNFTGIWSVTSALIAPQENPDYDYFTFGLITLTSQNIAYTPNEAKILFTFKNTGLCPDQIGLLTKQEALLFANSSENIGNLFFTNEGGDQNLWMGYGNGSWLSFDCLSELENSTSFVPKESFEEDDTVIETEDASETVVWPGDANNDGIANNFDLLTIGLTYGTTGPARINPSTVWEAQTATEWVESIDGTNYTHADCDGNGVIDLADIEVIQTNYNLGNENNPIEVVDGYPIWIEMPETWEPGSMVEFPIHLGTESQPIDNIYGLAFNISIGDNLFETGSLEIDFSNSYLGTEQVEMMGLSQVLNDNSIDIGVSRINQTDANGNGIVAVARGIIDDIAGKDAKTFEFTISNIKGVDAESKNVPITFVPSSMEIEQELEKTPIAEADSKPSINVYPMPSHTLFNIEFKGEKKPQSVTFYDLNGNSIYYNQELNSRTKTINLHSWPLGVYFVEVRYEEDIIWKKVVVD